MKKNWFGAMYAQGRAVAGLVFAVMALAACGGGGGGGGAAPVAVAEAEETGQLVIGLTDAEGDFLTYTLDVSAISLHRQTGAVVEALPVTTRVDFAELTEVTELLTVATVPAGVYDSVELTLDYTDADILVQDENGNGIPAQALDENGAPVTQITVELQLDGTDLIRIAPGIPAAFSLDFDLDASNDIDLSTDPATVTVAPFLLATPELEEQRSHRLRGLLVDADTDAEQVTLALRPFRHRRGGFGEYSFSVDGDTRYEVNGEGLVGDAGLAALAALDTGTPVIASGEVDDGNYLADTVLAGSSVPWTDSDVVKGVVTARTGNQLTVRGASIEYADGIRVVRDTVEVLIGTDTQFSAPGIFTGTLNEQSVSIGQRIVAFGELSSDLAADSAEEQMPQLDATDGRVRLALSSLLGAVVNANPLEVDLHLLSGRRPAAFDFTGTGVTSAEDADPERYQVDTATLPLTSVSADELIRVRGFVNDFASAPADFNAVSLITRTAAPVPALFAAGWLQPDSDPVVRIDDLAIALALEDARFVLSVLGRLLRSETEAALEQLTLIAPETGRGVYALRVRGERQIRLFRSFSALSAQLLESLEEGNRLRRVTAHGRYNGSDELITRRATIELTPQTEQ